MAEKENIQFTMNYQALKMFGRQQYSNAWAALSELVANGFDAKATDVHVYIDMREKQHSLIEIIDNGYGMDDADLKNKYAIIGRNRRKDNPGDKAAGRKGIGKLAALYLSDQYQIISIKDGDTIAWGVDVANYDDNSTPELTPIALADVNAACIDLWDAQRRQCGTMIRLMDVDLDRIGDRAIDALKQRLSNYFLFNENNRKLHLAIVRDANSTVTFETIEKTVAFDNMYFIYCAAGTTIPTQHKQIYSCFTDKSGNKHTLEFTKFIEDLPEKIVDAETRQEYTLKGDITIAGKTKQYELTGWIGVHSTIETKDAQANDKRFIRNKYYNPNQIRVYVRNKLANETFLSRLGLTGTYANYIEGEVCFDILDDDDLEDIATANRQEFTVEDARVDLLRYLLRGLCRQLIIKRSQFSEATSKAEKEINDKIRAQQKTSFARETHSDLLSAGVAPGKADELSFVISNKLTGGYDLKSSYKLFISHASKDHIFTDFVVNYLKHRGFCWDIDIDKTEIFYSSKGTDITSEIPLSTMIKTMLLDSNTDILFLTSNNFLDSQYCMFEGGAAWATRSVTGYSVISLDYNSIPEYLTNGKPEFVFSTKDRSSFELNEQSYTNLVVVLNRIIQHLNNNRIGAGKRTVTPILSPAFDDRVEMARKGKEPKDYMDDDLLEYWKIYVLDNLDTYFGTASSSPNLVTV